MIAASHNIFTAAAELKIPLSIGSAYPQFVANEGHGIEVKHPYVACCADPSGPWERFKATVNAA